MVAASTSSLSLQASVVNTTWTYMTCGKTEVPFGTKYVAYAGPDLFVWKQNKARSSVGSHLALLTLSQGYWGGSLS